MKIKIITIGNKMPAWINEGYIEYAKRLPSHCAIELIEISMPKRSSSTSTDKLIEKESELLLNAIQSNDYVIALDEKGTQWSTKELAGELSRWQHLGQNVVLLIGGPDGLGDVCKQRADQLWSLSKLTLPHPLVRVMLAEQLYRAQSLLMNHPYHRS